MRDYIHAGEETRPLGPHGIMTNDKGMSCRNNVFDISQQPNVILRGRSACSARIDVAPAHIMYPSRTAIFGLPAADRWFFSMLERMTNDVERQPPNPGKAQLLTRLRSIKKEAEALEKQAARQQAQQDKGQKGGAK